MTLAFALTLRLLVAADPCYFVSNTRIVVLPECDFSPEAMTALEAEEPPPRVRPPEPPRSRAFPGRGRAAERGSAHDRFGRRR